MQKIFVQKIVIVVQKVLVLLTVSQSYTKLNNKLQKLTANSIMNKYSFKAGMGQVASNKVSEAKSELMHALGITSHPAWLNRLRGDVEPRVSEVKIIEDVFANYGVTKNIWGE